MLTEYHRLHQIEMHRQCKERPYFSMVPTDNPKNEQLNILPGSLFLLPWHSRCNCASTSIICWYIRLPRARDIWATLPSVSSIAAAECALCVYGSAAASFSYSSKKRRFSMYDLPIYWQVWDGRWPSLTRRFVLAGSSRGGSISTTRAFRRGYIVECAIHGVRVRVTVHLYVCMCVCVDVCMHACM